MQLPGSSTETALGERLDAAIVEDTAPGSFDSRARSRAPRSGRQGVGVLFGLRGPEGPLFHRGHNESGTRCSYHQRRTLFRPSGSVWVENPDLPLWPRLRRFILVAIAVSSVAV